MTVYGIGYFALGPLTGVEYDESHNGAWWREWWAENQEKVSPEGSRAPVPGAVKEYVPSHLRPVPEAADVADITSRDMRAGGDENKRYLLVGPRAGSKTPLLILQRASRQPSPPCATTPGLARMAAYQRGEDQVAQDTSSATTVLRCRPARPSIIASMVWRPR